MLMGLCQYMMLGVVVCDPCVPADQMLFPAPLKIRSNLNDAAAQAGLGCESRCFLP